MDKSPTEIEKLVEKRETDLFELYKRMDDDFDIWNLKEVKYEGHKTGVNMTSNHPRLFANEVQSKLASAERQIRVGMAEAEGEDKREDIGKLERLLDFALEKADERLRNLLQPPLRSQLIWNSLIRGWMAARILVYKSGNDVIFDFLPLDPRWLTYEVGAEGLLWAAYKTFRAKAAIKDEYGQDIGGDAKSAPVIDYWQYEKEGKISNGTICEHDWLKPSKTYDMLSMPVLIAPVGISPPLIAGSDNLIKMFGDSIYASNRGAYATRNKFNSMWATQANILAKQPLIHSYDASQGAQPIKSTIQYAGGVLNLIKGIQEISEVPMKEISPTLVNLSDMLEREIERGSLPYVGVGRPPQSGTLQGIVQEARNIVFNPQLRLLSYFYADICRLIEEQLLTSKIKVNVKIEQKRKYYETEVKPVDLKKPHIIKVEFTARTPWTQLDTYQIADMAKRLGLPDGFIQEHILKLPDPKGLGDLSAIEMAEHSPKLAMVRAIKALMNAGREEEAEQLMQDMYNMQMQEEMSAGQMGEPSPSTPREAGEAEGAVPLPTPETPLG